MFPRGHFAGTYFAPTYFPPGLGVRRRGGPYCTTDAIPEKPFDQRLPLAEAKLLWQRIKERTNVVVEEDVEALLLLLLSDTFGSIGGVKQPLISISDDSEESILLAIASDPLWK